MFLFWILVKKISRNEVNIENDDSYLKKNILNVVYVENENI